MRRASVGWSVVIVLGVVVVVLLSLCAYGVAMRRARMREVGMRVTGERRSLSTTRSSDVLSLPRITALVGRDHVRVELSNDNDKALVRLEPDDRIVVIGGDWRRGIELRDLGLTMTLSPGQKSGPVVISLPSGVTVSRVRFEHVDRWGTYGTDVVPRLPFSRKATQP